LIETAAPVRDLAWCSANGLPDEIKEFATDVDGGLGVGSAGKVGVLDLTLANSGGATRVHRQYQRSPLYIYRPVYLDQGQPDMAFIFVQQSGDGIVQGDRYRIDISCSSGSAAHVTTQAATKVFGAHSNYASQLVHLDVGAGAILEYLPDPVIPFRGSRLFQRTTVKVHPESTVILGETVLPGRVAHGESHDYDYYWSETEVLTEDGDLLFNDLLRLAPHKADPRSPVLLGGFDVVTSLYFITARVSPESLTAVLRASLSDLPTAIAGVSELPNGCGVGVRVLAPTSKSAQSALNAAWDAARRTLLGTPAPHLRKG
jgi:urease accessory protein